jgi:hypothetical protein
MKMTFGLKAVKNVGAGNCKEMEFVKCMVRF